MSLSTDGSILAIGFDSNNANGFVKVYAYKDDDWHLRGEIISSSIITGGTTGYSSEKHFGRTVSISADGSVLAVSGIGGYYKEGTGNEDKFTQSCSAYVFKYNSKEDGV